MKIIFVYNAKSGFVNSILDIGHKVISPKTYECNLCSITYGLMSEKKEWRKFKESSRDELVFLHRDEFEKKYKEKREYPIVLGINETDGLDVLISADTLNEMKSVNDLIHALDAAERTRIT